MRKKMTAEIILKMEAGEEINTLIHAKLRPLAGQDAKILDYSKDVNTSMNIMEYFDEEEYPVHIHTLPKSFTDLETKLIVVHVWDGTDWHKVQARANTLMLALCRVFLIVKIQEKFPNRFTQKRKGDLHV